MDPIKFEVIRNALLEATEEMSISLKRSAYSTNIKTRADFSCAFFDHHLNAVAQAFTQPVHLGSMVELVPRVVKAYGAQNLNPGDALLVNDPYIGGVHLNDITLISPVFLPSPGTTAPEAKRSRGGAEGEGELVGYVANLAHHVDVGGGAPASIGAFREVFQEGIIIPPVKLVAGGKINDDVFRLVLSQIRSKHETAGDFRAQIAANNTGVRRLIGLMEKFGVAVVREYMDELIAYTERRTLAELSRLPRGVYRAEGFVDNDGYTDQRVKLVATVVINDEGVLFDLNGSDPQRRAPVNSTIAQTFSACAYALKCLIDPDVPTNAGFYRFVRVDAPLGTVVNCKSPAPVVGGWETQTRLVDVIFKALSPVMATQVPAGTKAMMCHAGFGGIDPRTHEYYCFLETMGGGYGARAASDGPDAVQTHGQNTENAPIEETEVNYPVRITRYELVEDSEGAGKFRGGLGLRRDYFFDHEPTFTILADRDREGPWGLFDGLAGHVAEYFLNPDIGAHGTLRSASGISDRAPVRLGSKSTLELHPGDVVSYRTCGGGGYGPAFERDPLLVLRDVREGKVSAARAKEIYGVAVDTTNWVVDVKETERLRTK